MLAWLVNGQPGNAISADDRGLAYGDGLFETIAIRRGEARFLERHFARLSGGCRRLGFPDPPLQAIGDDVADLIKGQDRGTVKVIFTRGSGPRGYRIPERAEPTRLVGFDAEARSADEQRPRGARVVSCRTPASCNPALAGLKTLNRLDNVLARSEWQRADADEGLMWDHRGLAVGGTMSNAFLVRKGRLMTPALDGFGILGVMRGIVIEAAAAMGLPVEEREITRREMEEADELFLTNALIGLWPVQCLDGRMIDVGPATRGIADELKAGGVGEAGQ